MTEETLKEYTVEIEVEMNNEEDKEQGTGFFIAKNRIVTCFHVITDFALNIKVVWKGKTYIAEILENNKEDDIAILETSINNEKFVMLHEIDEQIESKDGYYCYGFPNSEGSPLSFNIESNQVGEDGLYKFKDGHFEGGYSGSAILNKSTKKICAIVKSTRDEYSDLGGKGIPISKLMLLKNYEQLDETLYSSIPYLPYLPSEHLQREEDMRKIKEILLKENSNPNIAITGVSKKLGLHGMGGIGKSVFAIALGHDEEVRRYFKDGIYFIQLGQKPNIEEKQEKLLFHLYRENLDYRQSIMKEKIRDFFINKKALLIIDDIWDSKNINHFEVKGNSKILITTRQKNIIVAMGAKEYFINLLSVEQSLQLLTRKVEEIKNDISAIAEQILKRCGYLPLAINIIGNILKGKDKEYWENVLEKLEKSKLEKLKYTTMNEQHENLFKVIDLSVNYLDSEYKDKYLSLSVFDSIKSIPRVTLKIYWGEDYLDIIDKLINASLLFENKVRDKILYYVHDLQADYIKNLVSKKVKKSYKKEIRKEYKKKYSNNWSEVPLEDSYFYNNYTNIFKEEDIRKISEKLLYKKGLALPYIKNIINFLKLDKKDIGLKLLANESTPDVSIWILGILNSRLDEVQEYAKKYIVDTKHNIHFGLTIRCLNILDNNLEEVQDFSKRYITGDINKLDAGITIKCLDILVNDLEEIQEFSKRYIKQDIDSLDGILAIKCLDVLINDSKEIYIFSKKYLKQDIEYIHADLIIKCINILGNNSKEVQTFITKYIEVDIKAITPALAIKCLDILGEEKSFDRLELFAREYISLIIKQDFSDFDNGLLIKCLDIDNSKNVQRDLASGYINKIIFENFKNIDIKLVMKFFEILGKYSDEIKSFSKKYIEKDMKKNSNLLLKCLDVMGKDSKEVQNFSKKYLSQNDVNMNIFWECLNILDINLEEVEVFNRIKSDNNLIQRYINIFLRYDIKKYKSNIDKVSYSKYFKLLSISPYDLYLMLYSEHKTYINKKNLGEYAKYCDNLKKRKSDAIFKYIEIEEIYALYHDRANLIFKIMANFYLENKNFNFPNNILANLLKSVDKTIIYKEEIEKLFFNEINNKKSDMREKSIVDLANYYNDIGENKKAKKTIDLGIEIDLIQSDRFIEYAQNALIDAFCKSYEIRKIMGSKYNKSTHKMKQLLKKEDRQRFRKRKPKSS